MAMTESMFAKHCPHCGALLGAAREDGGPSTVDIERVETVFYRGLIRDDGTLEVWGDKSMPDGSDTVKVTCQNCNKSVDCLVTEEDWV